MRCVEIVAAALLTAILNLQGCNTSEQTLRRLSGGPSGKKIPTAIIIRRRGNKMHNEKSEAESLRQDAKQLEVQEIEQAKQAARNQLKEQTFSEFVEGAKDRKQLAQFVEETEDMNGKHNEGRLSQPSSIVRTLPAQFGQPQNENMKMIKAKAKMVMMKAKRDLTEKQVAQLTETIMVNGKKIEGKMQRLSYDNAASKQKQQVRRDFAERVKKYEEGMGAQETKDINGKNNARRLSQPSMGIKRANEDIIGTQRAQLTETIKQRVQSDLAEQIEEATMKAKVDLNEEQLAQLTKTLIGNGKKFEKARKATEDLNGVQLAQLGGKEGRLTYPNAAQVQSYVDEQNVKKIEGAIGEDRWNFAEAKLGKAKKDVSGTQFAQLAKSNPKIEGKKRMLSHKNEARKQTKQVQNEFAERFKKMEESMGELRSRPI